MSKVIASSTYDAKHRREAVLMNLRPLRKFRSPVELLTAIRCAIEAHRQVMRREHKINGNISPDTVWIVEATKSHPRGGYLCYNIAQKNPIFSSWKALRRDTLGCDGYEFDYLDDLESFFYLISYFCFAYTGPGARAANLLPESSWPSHLSLWASQPKNPNSINEKAKLLLHGNGFGFRKAPQYFGGFALDDLLGQLCGHLQRGVRRVRELGRQRTPREILEDAAVDYKRFLDSIDQTIVILESMERNKATQELLKTHVNPLYYTYH
ncbi:hypothetical protein M413DRAFT_22099 [Hebeloma cylindrosporum]|uniref:Fungal-type protein kinase domain-containing protein n=1 Tax=Hebeloma cylindrosporum TaxID=76867 RepID=A0A0C2YC26_HEBCY|nr:hypothetical protein M413DRAFT_22099 [Hebeloma cylindrosporum h7]